MGSENLPRCRRFDENLNFEGSLCEASVCSQLGRVSFLPLFYLSRFTSRHLSAFRLRSAKSSSSGVQSGVAWRNTASGARSTDAFYIFLSSDLPSRGKLRLRCSFVSTTMESASLIGAYTQREIKRARDGCVPAYTSPKCPAPTFWWSWRLLRGTSIISNGISSASLGHHRPSKVSVILLKELTDHISRYDCRQTNKHAHYNTLLPCQRRSNDQLSEMTVIHSCLFTVYCTASQNLYINCCGT